MFFLFGSLTTATNLKKTSQNPKKTPHSYRLRPGFTYYCHVVGTSPGEKPHFSKKCVPVLHETTLFREMGAPLTRNHTFSRNVCPSCTKPYLFEKCVPLWHETILFCKNSESRTRGYVNNSRNLPTSRTQRTQGRNIPVQGNPSLRYTICL